MSPRPLLVILTPGFPAREDDTTCIPPQQLFVKALHTYHPEIRLVVLTFQYPFTARRYSWNGIPVVAFGGRSRGGFLRVATWLKVANEVRRMKRKAPVAGFLSFWMGECAFVGHWLARRVDLPHFAWILGQDAREGNRYASLVRLRGDWLLALSDEVSRTFSRHYGVTPRQVVPVSIDGSVDSPLPPDRPIDVMGAGSLIPLKQFDLFLDTIYTVSRHIPHLRVVICGDGPQRVLLSARISELQLEHVVALKGETDYAEVQRLMTLTRVFLHTSAYEGFGAVMAEALFAGAHVLSLVSPMDIRSPHHHVCTPAELSVTLLQLLRDEELIHERVRMHSAEEVCAQVARLFRPDLPQSGGR